MQVDWGEMERVCDVIFRRVLDILIFSIQNIGEKWKSWCLNTKYYIA